MKKEYDEYDEYDEEEEELKMFYCTEQRGQVGGIRRYIIVSFLFVFFVPTLLILVMPGRECSAMTGIHFGRDEIAWKGYREGLAQAKREGKPAIIIFYSDSCSACKRYKGVLQEESVVEASRPFVMIRVNTRQHPQLSEKYQFDGRYIPRTFAVFPDGKIMHHLYPSKKYKYFVELGPENLLSLMQKAQAEIKH
ncbi:Thioredoxin-like [Candidatus Electrothrix aarhusensis]|uniref:Thioredoxin-like n=1 Tax=Candidatus Electrothrix aarhusensis TaxID=1859131 RepID=A0A444IV78_9BACT|nr:Thioredoxin-like [Candidatus Electrothrix aarhusensis]